MSALPTLTSRGLMSELIEMLKDKAGPAGRMAITELELRGFRFCVHFGYENAISYLREMDDAFDDGRLYEYLGHRLTGI